MVGECQSTTQHAGRMKLLSWAGRSAVLLREVLERRPVVVAGERRERDADLLAVVHLLDRHFVVLQVLLADDDDRLGVDAVRVPHLRAKRAVGNVALDDVAPVAQVASDAGRGRTRVADLQDVVVRRQFLGGPDAGALTEELERGVAECEPTAGVGWPPKPSMRSS